MLFEQIYVGCLSQAGYVIGDSGQAVVVDPMRDVDPYLAWAARVGVTIEHVVATHVHADFVAGTRELVARTGARCWMGARFDGPLPCGRLQDGDELRAGSVTLTTLETPGHTPESICLLVRDSADPEAPVRLLTGDTLFCGDVGRPDLVGSRGLTAEDMAGMLFDSIRAKILTLADTVEVWPGHGPGSACGKNIGSETSSTIGAQRVQNWALSERNRDAFVARLVENLAPPPRYFAHAADINRRGARLAQERPALRELSRDEYEITVENGAIPLDVRDAAEHGAGHPHGALNVALDGQFASWCGVLVDPERPIVVVARADEAAHEAVLRLARVGIENVIGWLRADNSPPTRTLPQLDVRALHQNLLAPQSAWQVVDVRRPAEYAAGHVPGARHAPLERLPDEPELLAPLDRQRPTAVICARGYRSSSATWFLSQAGLTDLHNVRGGTNAWRAAALPLEAHP